MHHQAILTQQPQSAQDRLILRYLAWPVVMALSMIGVRWAVLNEFNDLVIVLVTALSTLAASTVLERVLPLREDWVGRKKAWWVDFSHMPLTELLVQGCLQVIILTIGFLVGAEITRLHSSGPWRTLGLDGLAWPVQLGIAMVILDLGLYWQHRLFHRIPFFWATHRVHHSPRAMTAVSALRNHPVGPMITAWISTAFGALAMPPEVFAMAHMWIVVKGFLQHSNADLRTPGLDWVLATPRVHRWHHSTVREEADNNFGILTAVWDHVPWHRVPLLGPTLAFQRVTYYNPPDREGPSRVGTDVDMIDPQRSVFQNWLHQMLSPLKLWRAGGPMWKQGLTWLGWPAGVVGALVLAHTLCDFGAKPGAAALMVAVSSLLYGGLLQRLNPLRADWSGRHRDTGLDILHMGLSEGLAHALVNAVLGLLGAWLGWQVVHALGAAPWDILGVSSLPLLAQVALALLVLDLALYWQHRLFHEVPALWETHRVHHAIRTLGPTRTARHHPASPVATTLVWAAFGLLGTSPLVFVMCQAFAVSNGVLQHSNCDLRIGILDRIFAGPTFHRWHHVRDVAEANYNFGPNLSVWDQVPWHKVPIIGPRLRFQYVTFQSRCDRGPTEIGLDEPFEDDSRGIGWNWWNQVYSPIAQWGRSLRR